MTNLSPTADRLLALPAAKAVTEFGPEFGRLAARDTRKAAGIIAELVAMPRDHTRALTIDQRATRVGLLLADRVTVWQLGDFAAAAGVASATAGTWRYAYLRGAKPGRPALPAPDVPAARPYLPPGSDRPGRPPATHADPMWYAGTGWAWLLDKGLVDEDLYPARRARRVPAGRDPADDAPAVLAGP